MCVLLQMTSAHVWVGSKALVSVATLLVLLRLLLVLSALNENPQLLKKINHKAWVSNRGVVHDKQDMHGRVGTWWSAYISPNPKQANKASLELNRLTSPNLHTHGQ